MTEITTLTGNRTTGDTLSTANDSNGNAVNDGPVFVITANYWTDNSDAITIAAGQSEIDITFRDGGSVLNAFGVGDAIVANSNIRLTVNAGSSLVSGGFAVDMTSDLLTLVNFGLIHSTGFTTIASAGNGSRIDNYGEISSSGGVAYSSISTAGSVINNYGIFRSGSASSVALDLGNLNDVVNNFGTILGQTKFYGGTDTVFNSGTMRAEVAINGVTLGSGDKTITNTGFIGTTVLGNDAIALSSGSDIIFNFGEIYGTIHLGSGGDAYQAYDGATISAGVFGEAGDDNLIGNGFDDSLSGGGDNDTLIGNGGDDGLVGGAGNDDMHGGAGNDSYVVDSQGDTITDNIGRGLDAVNASANYALGAGAEIELLINNSAGGLTLTGNEFAQTIYGHLTASDTLAGGGGTDVLNGQGGNDIYNLGAFAASIVDSAGTADIVTSTITRSLASFATIEKLTLLGAGNGTGNGLANIITGSAAANILDGGLGADTLLGNAGNDTLIGGAGIDTLTGGANNDFFVFNAPLSAANRDIITDFSAPLDTFRLENAVMTKVGPVGALKATAFFAGAAAHDADDRIIYNKATGVLLYDSNGNLAGGVTQLATLTTLKPTLTAADFVVI